MNTTREAIDAACAVLRDHGVQADRAEILQNANTLVVRLNDTLVARIVQHVGSPRNTTDWFERENAIAAHLARQNAPVIPLHPQLPPGPHLRNGFPMNFWEYVHCTDSPLDPWEAGRRLALCHRALKTFTAPMPVLAILEESRSVADRLESESLMEPVSLAMLRRFLDRGLQSMARMDGQVLHGDAHLGNVLSTSRGLLWTDWEDAFVGPLEWDLASAIWNARYLDADPDTEGNFLNGYRNEWGTFREDWLEHCAEARAAVICVWYPLLYPHPDPNRRNKLQKRIEWLRDREDTPGRV